MSSIKIQNLPILKPIDAMKIPTGGFGDYAVTIGDIAEHFKLNSDFATDEELDFHINNKSNPHDVTKEQVGLGNVDNTSDINKPISTEVQNSLNSKANILDVYTKDEISVYLSDKADKNSVYEKNETYNKSELDTKIGAVSGGYFKAFDTLTQLQAATGMTTGQVAKVMNDPTTSNNGDYYYNGTLWIKGYDALTDANNYTDNKILEVYTDLDNLPILNPKFGMIDVTGKPKINVPVGTYVLNEKVIEAVNIKEIEIISAVNSGQVNIKTYTVSGTTITFSRNLTTLNILSVGVNTFSGLDLTLLKDEFVGFSTEVLGSVTYVSNKTLETQYYTDPNPDATSFQNTSQGKTAQLQIELRPSPNLTNLTEEFKSINTSIGQLNNFDQNLYQELIDTAKRTEIENQFPDIGFNLNGTYASASSATYLFPQVSTVKRNIKKISFQSGLDGAEIKVRTFVKSGTTWTLSRDIALIYSNIGYNEVDFSIEDLYLDANEYLAVSTTANNALRYISTNQSDVIYYSASSNSNVVTDENQGKIAFLQFGVYFTSTIDSIGRDLEILNNDTNFEELYKKLENNSIEDMVFGGLDKTGGSHTNVPIGTYVLNEPSQSKKLIRRIKFNSNVSSGIVTVKVFTLSSNTFTLVRTPIHLDIKNVGLNDFDNLSIQLNQGEYVGFSITISGVVSYVLKTTPIPSYYVNSSPTATSFDNSGAGATAQLQIEFSEFSNLSKLADIFSEQKELINTNSLVIDQVVGVTRFGVQSQPSGVSGSGTGNAGVAQWIPNRQALSDGKVFRFLTYASAEGNVQVGCYTKSGVQFSRQRYVEVPVVVGLNIIDIDLEIKVGEYIGLRTSVIGQTVYRTTSTGHDGVYSTTSLNDVADYTPTANMSFAFQFGFDQVYNKLGTSSSGSNETHWYGKSLVTFGDSITWYDGKAFASSHIEFGQTAKGYQSWVREELGCVIENRGQSGWDITQIYASQINPYNFSGVYATTITSGANDCRKGVPIGAVQPIGSTFNTATYAGALQASIEHVIASNPSTKIFLITPIRGWYNEYNTSNVPNPDPNVVGLMDEGYSDVMKSVGKLYGIPVLDWFNSTELNDLNKNYWLGDNPAVFTAYLLHPMNRFFQRMGETLIGFLKQY